MLGIDVGEKRIGIAVSEGRVAVPLTIVEHTKRAADLERIAEIAREQEAAVIVVGLPLDASGGEGEQARITRKFGEQLARAVDIPVLYEDERLSSMDVEQVAPRKRRAAHIDDLAAAVILQRHLDSAEPRG